MAKTITKIDDNTIEVAETIERKRRYRKEQLERIQQKLQERLAEIDELLKEFE